MTEKAKNVCDFIDNIDAIDDEIRTLRIENERLKKQTEWHYDEPTESSNTFYVILKNGNERLMYWSTGRTKDVVSGEHIPIDFIRCWKEIELPKEMQR